MNVIINLAARYGLAFTRPDWLRYLWLVPALWVLGIIVWRRMRPSRLLAALALRTAAFVLIILMLSGIGSNRLEEKPPVVLAAVDVSDSMGDEGRAWAIARARKMLEGAGKESEKGVILFARGSEMKYGTAKSVHDDWFSCTVGADATDVSSAIKTASLISSPGPRRLLVFSDGNENVGDARAAAAQASQAGIRIDCFSPPMSKEPHASLVKLDVPEEVNVSEKFIMRIIAENSGAEAAVRTLVLMDGAKTVKEWQVALQSGTNAFELPYDIVSPGTHRLTASLSAGDSGQGAAGLQSISMPIFVVDRPRVLCLSGTEAGKNFLAEVLSAHDIDVKIGGVDLLPQSMDELLAYDCVIFSNVPRSSLSDRQMKMIAACVRDHGGGFIMLGGPSSFGPGGYKGTPIEEILPVKIEHETPFETDKSIRLCTILLVDRSGSMVQGFAAKLTAARRAAEALVRQLKPNDRVGIIAFDDGYEVIVPLELVGNNSDYIVDRIRRTQSRGGGTMISKSLEEALRQMSASDGRVKHVILITDGETQDMKSYDYRSLIGAFGRQGVSVSTVGIGGDADSRFLRAVSIGSKGDYYYVKDASTLPLIVLEDNRKTLQKSGFAEDAFIPIIGDRSEMLKGIGQEQIPRLLGYVITTARQHAEVALYTNVRGPRDPVLAGWRCGLGKTIAYTSDAEARWSREMVGWEMFGKFWAQVLRWAMRERSSDYYLVKAKTEGGRQYCELTTFSPLKDGTSFQIVLPAGKGEKGRIVRLHQTAPSVFAGEVRGLTPSIDSVTVEKMEHGKVIDRKEVALIRRIASRISSPEALVKGNNEALLRAVAQAAGGRLNPKDDELVFQVERVSIHRGLAGLLLPFVFIFLLLDIAVRKLWM